MKSKGRSEPMCQSCRVWVVIPLLQHSGVEAASLLGHPAKWLGSSQECFTSVYQTLGTCGVLCICDGVCEMAIFPFAGSFKPPRFLQLSPDKLSTRRLRGWLSPRAQPKARPHHIIFPGFWC